MPYLPFARLAAFAPTFRSAAASTKGAVRVGSLRRAGVALLAAAAAAALGADGLSVPQDVLTDSRWQGRVETDSSLLRTLPMGMGLVGPAQGVQTTRLLGDFALDAWRLGSTAGLRVSSGLLFNQRLSPSGALPEVREAWPYVGLGLGHVGTRGDWGFQADFGLAAESLGAAVRLGRMLNGGVSVGDALRDLRLQPVVRLGMNYRF